MEPNLTFMRLARGVLAIALLALIVGCASPAQESDWRWKQWNPNYRPPIPPVDGL